MLTGILLPIFYYTGRTYAKLDIAKINDQINGELKIKSDIKNEIKPGITSKTTNSKPSKFYLTVEDLGLCITTGTDLTGLNSRDYSACYEDESEEGKKVSNGTTLSYVDTLNASKISKNFEFFYNKSSFFVKNSHGKCLQGRPNTIPCGAFDGKSSNFDAEPILRNFKPEISEFIVKNYLATFEDCNFHLPQQKWRLTNGTFFNDECESGAQLIFQVPGVMVTAIGFDSQRKGQNEQARDVYRLDARTISDGNWYDGNEKLLT